MGKCAAAPFDAGKAHKEKIPSNRFPSFDSFIFIFLCFNLMNVLK